MIITVIGLMFGDEGKGHTVSKLTQMYDPSAIVRFSGGSQAAHRVVYNGKSHIFAQIGSGSAVSPTVKTYLSSQMAIDPLNLDYEISVHHSNGVNSLWPRLFIDSRCPIITPYHKALNKAREINRGEDRISTTGLGVGEVFDDEWSNPELLLRAGDVVRMSWDMLYEKIEYIARKKLEIVKQFSQEAQNCYTHNSRFFIGDYINNLNNINFINCIHRDFDNLLEKEIKNGDVILEGSQGTLLDIKFGFKPYISRSEVALYSANKLLSRLNVDMERYNIGVVRSYVTRHGLGYFATESHTLTKMLPDAHNEFNQWQREFRCGWSDLVLLKYSVGCNKGLDGIIITNMDRSPYHILYKDVDGYIKTGTKEILPGLFSKTCDLPVLEVFYSDES